MEWSSQQSGALEAIHKWIKGGKRTPQVFKLFGYAGTGKTTISIAIQDMVGRVLYAAFTGKAALVMQSKGCTDAGTLHSLIYKVQEDEHGKIYFTLNPDSALKGADVLVVDEASMVGPELGNDVLSFGKKVLIIGDPFQLPPVKDTGFFTEGNPDYMLSEIRRQAAENPIIRMSMDIREGRRLNIGKYGESRVMPRHFLSQRVIFDADQILCGLNKTRLSLNERFRSLSGKEGFLPSSADKIVCLRNNREKGLLNGGLWTVSDAALNGDIVEAAIKPEGRETGSPETEIKVPIEFFQGQEDKLNPERRRLFDEFDFGYALTVHKSQGSQFPNVVLFNESGTFRQDANRWLYTGITRAAEKITVVI